MIEHSTPIRDDSALPCCLLPCHFLTACCGSTCSPPCLPPAGAADATGAPGLLPPADRLLAVPHPVRRNSSLLLRRHGGHPPPLIPLGSPPELAVCSGVAPRMLCSVWQGTGNLVAELVCMLVLPHLRLTGCVPQANAEARLANGPLAYLCCPPQVRLMLVLAPAACCLAGIAADEIMGVLAQAIRAPTPAAAPATSGLSTSSNMGSGERSRPDKQMSGGKRGKLADRKDKVRQPAHLPPCLHAGPLRRSRW